MEYFPSSTSQSFEGADGSTQAGRLDGWARTAVFARLKGLRGGITFRDALGTTTLGDGTSDPLEVSVAELRFYRRMLLGGSIGAAEAYMDGQWSCSDLVGLIRLVARNQDALGAVEGGIARVMAGVDRIAHALRRNTRAGSKRNIAAHYDLSNEFFALFLDRTMTYSAGVYPGADATLEEASREKLDRICRKLELGPADHVLEIGTGWGSFALHAARHYGCRVTTTTISEQQHLLARERIAAAGLSDRITLLRQDYRNLTGRFDKLVSIEMIEAVGHAYLPTYFAKCAELLKPEGRMALQAITMGDQAHAAYRRNADFVNRYIFPGGALPSVTSMCNAMTAAGDLRLHALEDITPHYARTLAEWRSRFRDQEAAVRGLGFDDRFLRMWEYYLCYCEAGFRERTIGTVQIVLAKPGYRE